MRSKKKAAPPLPRVTRSRSNVPIAEVIETEKKTDAVKSPVQSGRKKIVINNVGWQMCPCQAWGKNGTATWRSSTALTGQLQGRQDAPQKVHAFQVQLKSVWRRGIRSVPIVCGATNITTLRTSASIIHKRRTRMMRSEGLLFVFVCCVCSDRLLLWAQTYFTT